MEGLTNLTNGEEEEEEKTVEDTSAVRSEEPLVVPSWEALTQLQNWQLLNDDLVSEEVADEVTSPYLVTSPMWDELMMADDLVQQTTQDVSGGLQACFPKKTNVHNLSAPLRATLDKQATGFPIDMVEDKLPKHLSSVHEDFEGYLKAHDAYCLICGDVARDAVGCSSCLQTVGCHHCAFTFAIHKGEPSCPLCRSSSTFISDLGVIKFISRNLRMKCVFHDDDDLPCKFIGDLSAWKSHMAKCTYPCEKCKNTVPRLLGGAKHECPMRVFATKFTGHGEISLAVTPSTTILELKKLYKDKLRISETLQMMRYNGKPLQDRLSLRDYDITEDDLVQVTLRRHRVNTAGGFFDVESHGDG